MRGIEHTRAWRAWHYFCLFAAFAIAPINELPNDRRQHLLCKQHENEREKLRRIRLCLRQ